MSFIDNPSVASGKSDKNPVPAGEEQFYFSASEWNNKVCQPLLDLRAHILDGYLGLDERATAPTVTLSTTKFWAKTDGNLMFTRSGVDKSISQGAVTTKGDVLVYNGTAWVVVPAGTDTHVLTADSTVAAGVKWAAGAGGGGTFAASYAAGTVAADQTPLINAGDGGPVTFKANAAATGPVLQAKNSADGLLFSVADNQAAYIAGANADAGSVVGVRLDTVTTLTGTRKYTVFANGGSDQWGMHNSSGNGPTIEAVAGTSSYFLGNGEVLLANAASLAGYLYLTATASVFGNNNVRPSADISQTMGISTHRWLEVLTPTVKNSTSVSLLSSAADGAAAVAGIVDTTTLWANATAKIFSICTNAVEQFNFRPSGHIYGDSANPFVQLDDTAGARLFYGTTGVRMSSGLHEYDVSGGTRLELTTAAIRPGTDLGITLGTSGRRYQEAWAAQLATIEKVVAFSATPAFTPVDGDTQQITMTNNITGFTVAAGLAGEVMTLLFIQDATGTRTLAGIPANVRPTAGAMVLTVTANKADAFTFRYNTALAAWMEIGRALNL